MPYYRMTLNIEQKLRELSLATVGREPVTLSNTGHGREFCGEFDPDLTQQERIDLLNAMPEWVRFLYDFTVEPGTLQPPEA